MTLKKMLESNVPGAMAAMDKAKLDSLIAFGDLRIKHNDYDSEDEKNKLVKEQKALKILRPSYIALDLLIECSFYSIPLVCIGSHKDSSDYALAAISLAPIFFLRYYIYQALEEKWYETQQKITNLKRRIQE